MTVMDGRERWEMLPKHNRTLVCDPKMDFYKETNNHVHRNLYLSLWEVQETRDPMLLVFGLRKLFSHVSAIRGQKNKNKNPKHSSSQESKAIYIFPPPEIC